MTMTWPETQKAVAEKMLERATEHLRIAEVMRRQGQTDSELDHRDAAAEIERAARNFERK